jgi:aminomethyltransferase
MVQVTTAFATYLATRGAATLTVAPGITTPRRFSDTRREHLATRRAAGLFDFSFMSCAEITGEASMAFLNSLQTRRLNGLQTGRIAYALLLRDDGSVLNDATVWRLACDRCWLFSGRRSDFEHVARCAEGVDVGVTNVSQQLAVIAIQGAASRRVIERCFAGQHRTALPYYGFQRLEFAGSDCWLARIGYSGETGYEIVIADGAAPALWQALLAAGADIGLTECGFDAIDTLRIEAGHILFTCELAARVTPFELGLARLVDFYREPFRGARALLPQRWRQPSRRLVGLLPASDVAADRELPGRIAPGCAVMTSACRSPLYERCLGMGFVNAEDVYTGTTVKLRNGIHALVARLPFYDPARCLPRRAL